jgi:chromosome segregation ATPase
MGRRGRALPPAATQPVGLCLDTSSRLAFLQADFARLCAAQSEAAAASAEAVKVIARSAGVAQTQVADSHEAARLLSDASAKVQGDARSAVDEATEASAAITEAHEIGVGLARRSNDLDDLVKAIFDITRDINLLALNAKIEAVQAGDAGRGFAVVADSVRDLSVKTREATERAQQLISATVDDVRRSTEMVEAARASAERSRVHAASAAEQMRQVAEHGTTIAQSMSAAVAEVNQLTVASREIEGQVEMVAERAGQASATADQIRASARTVLGAAVQLRSLSATSRLARHSTPKRLLDLTEVVRGTTVHALDGTPADVAEAVRRIAQLDRRIELLCATRRGEHIGTFRTLWSEYAEMRNEALRLATEGRSAAALDYTAKFNRPKYQQIRAHLTEWSGRP